MLMRTVRTKSRHTLLKSCRVEELKLCPLGFSSRAFADQPQTRAFITFILYFRRHLFQDMAQVDVSIKIKN